MKAKYLYDVFAYFSDSTKSQPFKKALLNRLHTRLDSLNVLVQKRHLKKTLEQQDIYRAFFYDVEGRMKRAHPPH